ncbi:putative C-terminal regulatory domain of Threonine dehydratase [Haemophilus pittmaniae HK 85]|uniref:Putative C-terminal regulatory domain of Threonine dehydratase n=1 Tax=Haemophilus pittmaniae HK 85 TaxID=1035188 RepID=F9Q8H3_9PAST|nr:putative C-terminal regulatory domain of Threonine dehydratase [Haemophilus pittmaniae HK 85]
MGKRWNISLFHYRAHGADYGNILAAFQLEQGDPQEFEQALKQLGYVYQDVSDSKAYRYF